jgi:hypothetical protein
MAEASSSGDPGRGKRIAYTILSAVFALGALLGMFGIALFVGWFQNDDGGIHKVHYVAGFGITAGILITTGLAAQLWPHPERRVAGLQQVGAAGLGGLLGGLMAGSPGAALFIFLAAAVAVAVLAALHPDRPGLLSLAGSFSPLLAGLTALAAVAVIPFALTMARMQREGLAIDPHVKQAHWAFMTMMAIGVLLVGALASLRTRGWRIPAWSLGAAGVAYGLASLVFPHHAGARGVGWGIVWLAGGMVYIAAAEWEARRRPVIASA